MLAPANNPPRGRRRAIVQSGNISSTVDNSAGHRDEAGEIVAGLACGKGIAHPEMDLRTT
jgi:hypothetical protein